MMTESLQCRVPAVRRAVFVLAVGVAGLGLIIALAHAARAQTATSDVEASKISVGRVGLDQTARKAWGLDETDWKRYRTLMAGPSGLWYAHLAPAMVLGINAESDLERMRWARIVWEQEQARLDALFAFNRAYQKIARADRARPGFSIFEEQLLRSPVQPVPRAAETGRIRAFVSPDCADCENAIRTLAATGNSFDVYVVGARDDREIQILARRANIPVERVIRRSITLNHDSGERLLQAGHQVEELPLFFTGTDLQTPVPLSALLGRVP